MTAQRTRTKGFTGWQIFVAGSLLFALGWVALGWVWNGATIRDLPEIEYSDYTYTQIHMAMPIRITVWAQDEGQARRAGRAAFKRIAELVQVFSNYDPESELNRLVEPNGAELPGGWRAVSPDMLAVLTYCKEIYQRTGGAFDPSAGPIIDLWKKSLREKKLPSQPVLEVARDRVGFDQLEIDSENGNVRVLRPDLQLDLGAVAKGYIADQALQVIREEGIDSACVEAGGDFVVGQAPPETPGWEIEAPELGGMSLENCGISVSGDTVQFTEIDAIRYSHVIDPRTGVPLTNRMMAVVIAPRAMQSDALATAACILEKSEVERILEGVQGVRFWRWPVKSKEPRVDESQMPAERP